MGSIWQKGSILWTFLNHVFDGEQSEVKLKNYKKNTQ